VNKKLVQVKFSESLKEELVEIGSVYKFSEFAQTAVREKIDEMKWRKQGLISRQ